MDSVWSFFFSQSRTRVTGKAGQMYPKALGNSEHPNVSFRVKRKSAVSELVQPSTGKYLHANDLAYVEVPVVLLFIY